MVIRIATGGTGSLSLPDVFSTRSPGMAAHASMRLGTFDFHAGLASQGVWCRSSSRMLGWRWGTGSIDKFIDQVVDADRARIQRAWRQLRGGEMIDCELCVQVGEEVRVLRFVAGRSDDGASSHVAGIIQDITPSRQARRAA